MVQTPTAQEPQLTASWTSMPSLSPIFPGQRLSVRLEEMAEDWYPWCRAIKKWSDEEGGLPTPVSAPARAQNFPLKKHP